MQSSLRDIFLSLIIVYIIALFSPMLTNWALVGIFIFIYTGLSFFNNLGISVPIKQLILLVAGLQWVIAPIFSYHYFNNSMFYYMVIEEEEYLSFVVPAILFFSVGLTIGFNKIEDVEILEKSMGYYKKAGYFLFFVGAISYVLNKFVPASLGYVFYLLSSSIVIGAIYLFVAKVYLRYVLIFIAFLPFVFLAGESSVFHDMILWGGFLFLIYAFINKIGTVQKLLLLTLGVIVITLIQLIKQEYREAIMYDKTIDKTELALQLASDKVESENIKDDFWQSYVDRFNQGWIVARIMHTVPAYEPYAEGETIVEGVKAALLPRFLNPNKAKSGGIYFERFTNLLLMGASMNLGIVGEAYANYGRIGGVIFMFIYGFFFNVVMLILSKNIKKRSELIFWIPFLFFYVVKAEDDFTTAFNQFIKSVIVLIGMMWLLKTLFKREINESNK